MALLTGAQLVMLVGPTVPLPAPALLTEAVERVEVTQSDTGPSGFQIVFKAGRGQPFNPVDYPLLQSPLLKPFNRIILLLRIGVMLHVLFDGIMTDRQFTPGTEPGAAILTITGEDLSVMLDLEEKVVAHPAQNEVMIATKIIASYARYGLIPMVIPPPTLDLPLPTERVPVQHGTDLAYLRDMAARYAYDFYLTPGPAPGASTAYWGPPQQLGLLQRALTFNMGPQTNLNSINFRYDALAPQKVMGRVDDRRTDQVLPLRTLASTRPPLSRAPALLAQSHVRTTWRSNVGGLTATDALTRVQADTNVSADRVVTAAGEVDVIRYGGVLEARRLVGVRGVGDTFDGLYYVRQVTHVIEPGTSTYRQQFTLTREGVGTLTPVVVP